MCTTAIQRNLISGPAARARAAHDSSRYPVARGRDIHPTEDLDDPFDLSGVLLGARYRLVRPLGRRVTLYQARRASHGDPLLVRVIVGLEIGDPTQRFLMQAQAACHLHHGHIVRVSDFGVDMLPDGRSVGYLVMEPLNGENLIGTLAKQGPLHWTRVVTIAKQICRALIAGQDRGLVHGDLRLANCLRISRPGAPDFIKVLDFGISTDPTKIASHGDDLHALSTLMFRLLTGRTPGPAPSLRHDVPMLQIPPVIAALVVAMLTPGSAQCSPSARCLYRALVDAEAAAMAPAARAPIDAMVVSPPPIPPAPLPGLRPVMREAPSARPSRIVAAIAAASGPNHCDQRVAPAELPASPTAPDLPTPPRPPTWSEWMFWLPLGVMTTMAVHAALQTF